MIPAMNTIAWSKKAPWAEQRQIEQDLIICRALVEMFNDGLLRAELRFRGGTALNKLHFPKPLRYSEDIDLVCTREGPMKPILDRVHELLDPWLGEPTFERSRVAPKFKYSVEAEDKTARIRLKIETNRTEIDAYDDPVSLPLIVDNAWFSGKADIPTFSTEEILSTKLRALLQRNKGRDLIDLSHALEIFPKLDTKNTVAMFGRYIAASGTPISRAQAEQRMFDKLSRPNFMADVRPLLAAEEAAKFDDAAAKQAFTSVFRGFIQLIPGKAWATTPEMIKKFELKDID